MFLVIGFRRYGTQHTAYRQFRSVFGIASIPNTDFRILSPNKFNIYIHWLENAWKDNAQHIAELDRYLGLHQSQIQVSIWNSMKCQILITYCIPILLN